MKTEKTNAMTTGRKGLTEEQRKFANDNYGLVYKACKAYHVPEHLFEDCLQAGWEVFLEKIPDFDASRATFSTFIFPWLRNAFANVQKENGTGITWQPKKADVRVISMDKKFGRDESGKACDLNELLEDDRADIEGDAVGSAMVEQLEKYVRFLEPREQQVLTLYYNLGSCSDSGLSLREIARKLGTTRTTVSNVLDRAEGKLRRMFEYGTQHRFAA